MPESKRLMYLVYHRVSWRLGREFLERILRVLSRLVAFQKCTERSRGTVYYVIMCHFTAFDEHVTATGGRCLEVGSCLMPIISWHGMSHSLARLCTSSHGLTSVRKPYMTMEDSILGSWWFRLTRASGGPR